MLFTYFIDFLKRYIHLNNNLESFAYVVLVMCLIALVAFFNLLFFLIVNYYLSSDLMVRLEEILPKFLVKLLKVYKLASIVTIIVESGFGVLSLLYLIWLCVRILFIL